MNKIKCVQTECIRCGVLCRVSETPPNPNAMPLQRANKRGMCANCALTDFIKHSDVIMAGIEKWGVGTALRNSLVQKQFGAVFAAGHSDAPIEQINWEKVIENWDLPVSRTARGERAMSEARETRG